ncbi:hypothetical protein HYQ46_009822 [Verticillium longisporum]|nr:hypothetical protein HYQ46_009822 [Verticillium longisporum]
MPANEPVLSFVADRWRRLVLDALRGRRGPFPDVCCDIGNWGGADVGPKSSSSSSSPWLRYGFSSLLP